MTLLLFNAIALLYKRALQKCFIDMEAHWRATIITFSAIGIMRDRFESHRPINAYKCIDLCVRIFSLFTWRVFSTTACVVIIYILLMVLINTVTKEDYRLYE